MPRPWSSTAGSSTPSTSPRRRRGCGAQSRPTDFEQGTASASARLGSQLVEDRVDDALGVGLELLRPARSNFAGRPMGAAFCLTARIAGVALGGTILSGGSRATPASRSNTIGSVNRGPNARAGRFHSQFRIVIFLVDRLAIRPA